MPTCVRHCVCCMAAGTRFKDGVCLRVARTVLAGLPAGDDGSLLVGGRSIDCRGTTPSWSPSSARNRHGVVAVMCLDSGMRGPSGLLVFVVAGFVATARLARAGIRASKPLVHEAVELGPARPIAIPLPYSSRIAGGGGRLASGARSQPEKLMLSLPPACPNQHRENDKTRLRERERESVCDRECV